MSRRRALAVGGAAAVTGLAAACSAHAATGSPVPPPPDVPLRVRTRWTARPDGPLPARGDEGVPFTLTGPDIEPPPSVAGGALVGHLPDRHGAAYVLQTPGGGLRRIGATFGFGPGTTDGSLALVLFSPGRPFSGPCHLAIAPDRWVAGTLVDAAVTEIGSGTFATPIPQDGRPVRVDAVVVGDALVVRLPDGSLVGPRGPDVAALPAATACWEFFRDAAGGADVHLYDTWAG
ncbi:hypothetical protein [Actinomycetospora sp. TBRC 11914]|uniref:hypothetical protein n=1 Tax=Actinomycetospora sp. TBRC 11914 TaxID=2729387 RepID=UPI00145D2C7D|nr:hypothetical protein [Actinomycetospora sp. TBRC 11914]NMO90384.1 hypothetical protein [Actinomycetospora sp. TBRC 11914]